MENGAKSKRRVGWSIGRGGDSTHTAECMLDGSADSLLLTEARVSVSGCSSPHSIVLEREGKRTSCREEKGVNAQTHTLSRGLDVWCSN